MLSLRPAMAIVMTGVFSGALLAQAVPTELAQAGARPSRETTLDNFPEIVGIQYETLPGARSDPYNFGPVPRFAELANWRDQFQLGPVPEYVEPVYADESDYEEVVPQRPSPDEFDLQVIEDEELPVEDNPDLIASSERQAGVYEEPLG